MQEGETISTVLQKLIRFSGRYKTLSVEHLNYTVNHFQNFVLV